MAALQESARLQALARVAGAASHGGGLDGVLVAIAEGIRDAFGYDAVLNFLDPGRGVYVVRALVGEGGPELMGSTNSPEAMEAILDPAHEVTPDVYFIPHDPGIDSSQLGPVFTPGYEWRGPGYWHPEDFCFVRMRTSRGKPMGVLSVDSTGGHAIPDADGFELLRLFAMVGANAAENALLVGELAAMEAEQETQALRDELQEEVALRRSLLEIGGRLGAASASAVDPAGIFPLVAERLDAVVPIKAVTIYAADQEDRTVRPIYHFPPDDLDLEGILSYSFEFGSGATGTAAEHGATVLSNVGQAGRIKVDLPNTTDVDEHLLCVPVLVEERARAVLTMRRPEHERPFTSEDAHRAELFAQHVAAVFLLSELANSRRLLAEQVETLESLNRLKDEFVANVSHELRTPLTAVIGNVMTVAGLGDMLGADERRELLTAAERQAKRLAELLENLLAESRLVGDDPMILPARIELGPFVEEVVGALRFRAPDRQIETKASRRLDMVTDRTLLYRILLNLGDNALKYSDGPVLMRAQPEGDGVRIDVVDRGPGIAPGDIPRIFEQFEQLDGSSSRMVGGVGLGLHLVAKAAQVLGGRIDVQSEVGIGSTFSVWLPRTFVPARAVRAEEPAAQSSDA